MHVTYTAVVSKMDEKYLSKPDLKCNPLSLGAHTAPVSAVYAGFNFRRLFVRRALGETLTEELLGTATPYSESDNLRGVGVEQFQMKPSFAYRQRILERLPELAHLEAERDMLQPDTRNRIFDTPDGRNHSLGTSEAVSDYWERVEDVEYQLSDARLHDRGVILLPMWVVEYVLLGQPFRAFVSGLPPRDAEPRVAGFTHDSGFQTGDASLAWKLVGEMRENELNTNESWKVQRYWLDEVRRVMPDFQKVRERNASGGGFKGFRAGGGESPHDDDYKILGLPKFPPPTSEAVAAAFRAQALVAHPDIMAQRGLSDEELAACTRRFQNIVDAHARLRRQHPKFLDCTRPK